MRFKYLGLFALTLLFPILNYGMIAEKHEHQNIGQSDSDVVLLRNKIGKCLCELKILLGLHYPAIAKQKGWFWETEESHNGALPLLHGNMDPSKKAVLNQIQNYFIKNNDNEITQKIINFSVEANAYFSDLPNAMIESKIKEYFENTANIGNVLEIKDKGEGNGVQFGKIAFIRTGEGKILQYYVKTHQLGLLSKTGRSAQSVDLKEPFAYKFLELCGISPEVHFFYDDDKYFYIATKNEGYSGLLVENEKGEPVIKGKNNFLTYDKVLLTEETRNAIYENKELLDYAFLMTDFYSRLLNLSDVLANHGNVGFIKANHGFFGFKIIDFRVPETRERYKLKNIFGGWVDGNNEYNYSDKYVVELLRNGEVKTKQQKILPHIKHDIPEKIKEACNYVLEIGKKVFYKDEKFKGYTEDLINYADTVQIHYKELHSGIQDKI